ncbi:hypothetical protein N7456_006511 [Penicillium angulare]|uniref:Nitrogen regulatory protein areA GATA-like domain-containing protein n=1 Tax=Penicillium angulare TaxID=116970 RepID=A0A9W9FHY3_9EURO|nr:hypothetical protein N7456_006511 [Penicillium angulare]
MAQKIPESLVTISQIPSPSEILGEKNVDRTMIKGFWQAFFISRQASNKEMDRRLEYLFWRIWSSDDLLGRTNIKYLDGLVSRIMASEPLPSSSPNKQDTVMPNSDSQKYMGSKSVPPNGTPGSGSLHPILKKPNTAPTPQKTTRLLLEHPGGENITTNPSNPPTPSVIEIAPKDDFSTTKQPAKKATHFTTGRTTRGGKRRPVFNRRKSSQTSISKPAPAPSPASAVSQRDRPIESQPRDSPEPMFDVDEDDDLSAPLDPQTVAESRQASAATSWADLTLTPMTSSTPLIPSRRQSSKVPPQLAPTLLDIDIADKQDPILPQGIETVSPDLNMQETQNPNTESQASSYETVTNFNVNLELTGSSAPRNILNPEKRKSPRNRPLSDREAENRLLDGHGHVHQYDHTWHPPPRESFLINYMLRNAQRRPPQPLNEPLVSKNFRAQWLQLLEEVKNMEASGKNYDVMRYGEEEGAGDNYQDNSSAVAQCDEDQTLLKNGIGTDEGSSSGCQTVIFLGD